VGVEKEKFVCIIFVFYHPQEKVMTYAEVVQMVRGKTNRKERKVGNNTYAEIEYDDSVSIRLHGTAVVRFYPNGTVKLNSGGWRTHTTKKRINQYSPVYVYQKKYEWYLADGTPFEDNVLI
jgi:hypothetical protein